MAWLTTDIRSCGLGCLRTRHDSGLSCKHTKLHKHAGPGHRAATGRYSKKSRSKRQRARNAHSRQGKPIFRFLALAIRSLSGPRLSFSGGQRELEFYKNHTDARKQDRLCAARPASGICAPRIFFPEDCTAQAG